MKTSTPMSAAADEWREKTRRPLLTPVGEEQGLSPVLRAAATSRDAARKSRDHQSPAIGSRQDVAAEGCMSPVRRIAAREINNSDVKSRVYR